THADTLRPSGRLRALFLCIGRQGGRRLSTRESTREAHTGLVSELLAGLSPAPRTTRGFLMAVVIIPHFLSILRWLGRPRLLTRLSSLRIATPEVSAQMRTWVDHAIT